MHFQSVCVLAVAAVSNIAMVYSLPVVERQLLPVEVRMEDIVRALPGEYTRVLTFPDNAARDDTVQTPDPGNCKGLGPAQNRFPNCP